MSNSKILITSMILYASLILLATSQTNGELEKGLMKHVTQLSQQECVHKCELLQNCLSAVYNRPLALCKLYKIIPERASKSGVTVYLKQTVSSQSEDGQCTNDDCLSKNFVVSCDEPPAFPATEILGNMASVGSKVIYRCLDGSMSFVSSCSSDGFWSSVDVTCTCAEPLDANGQKLKDVKSWKYFYGATHFTAKAECTENCQDIVHDTASCDLNTGKWTYTTDICCNDLVQGKSFKNIN